MSTPATPSARKPAGDDRNLVAVDAAYVAPTFEDKMRLFWEKNGKAVQLLCVLVLAGIVAKGGWDYWQTQKDLGVQGEFAAAATPEKLKAFAAAHAGHPLAGAALLRMADEAVAAGRNSEAVPAYEQAVAALNDGPFAARARLGLAMAKILGGKAGEGATDLKSLMGDAALPKGVRAEAAYQLASLAATAGISSDVQKYAAELSKIDAQSPWNQRALGLLANLPVTAETPAAPAAKSAAPTIKLPGGK